LCRSAAVKFAPEKFRAVRFNFNHNYNQTSREAVYAWFDHWLSGYPDAPSMKELPYEKEPDASLRVFPDDKFPADALTRDEVIHSLIERSKAQWQALQGGGKRGLDNYKKVMLPAWGHSLQLEWPAKTPDSGIVSSSKSDSSTPEPFALATAGPGSAIAGTIYRPRKPASRVVILAGADRDSKLPSKLVEWGDTVLVVSHFSTEPHTDQFSDFFTTYNRTEAQERVRDLTRVCAFAHARLKAREVILCGLGRSGLWATLAAPAADAVIADCDQLDISNDETLLASDLFSPGLRSMGGFEGAALLAAPHPLFVFNTGQKFPTAALRAGYENVGELDKLRIASDKIGDDEIVKWAAGLK
jgi:hypothetical protein